MRTIVLLAAGFVLLACEQQTTSQPGSAGTPQETAKPSEYAVCNNDLAKLCPNVQPGEGRLVACLKDHKEEVSQPCRDFWKL